jgi:NAD(P)H-hydrate epimerase
MGAAVLASRACLRGGVGLLTTHVPNMCVPIVQIAVPEAMCSADASDLMFSEFPDLSFFSAIGVGPGIGIKLNSQRALHELLGKKSDKIVLDADALNILSKRDEWLCLLPENTILTPHPKEFERLVGPTTDSWSRLQRQIAFSKKYKVIVVLKGAYTCISFPGGEVFFNTTGNPGMATAGSGDVLTGLILGLLAQPYSPDDAALLGVYLHGLAGDLAAEQTGQEALTSGDLIKYLGKAFLHAGKQNE